MLNNTLIVLLTSFSIKRGLVKQSDNMPGWSNERFLNSGKYNYACSFLVVLFYLEDDISQTNTANKLTVAPCEFLIHISVDYYGKWQKTLQKLQQC